MASFKRILIIGSAGSGKTILANELAKKLNIKVVHLDKIYWNSNWQKKEEDECLTLTDEVVKEEEWILDGNYIQTLDKRLERAELVIFLKINRFKCISSLYKRKRLTRKNLIKRDDLATGCSDKLDFCFIKWAFNFNNEYAPKLMEKIKQYPHIKVVTFNKRRDAMNFIEQLTEGETNEFKN